MYRNGIKRILDFCLALVALICLSPLLLAVTIWLHFANKGAGAFFLQERPGLHERIFRVIKFKTMTDERDDKGNFPMPNASQKWANSFVPPPLTNSPNSGTYSVVTWH